MRGYPPEFMNVLEHRLSNLSLPLFDRRDVLPFLECNVLHVLCKCNIKVAEAAVCELWQAL